MQSSSPEADVPTAAETVLETRGVTKGFDGDAVLRGVDLSVSSGEIVVLMGANGAGKSLLLSCLAGSATPDDGTIRLFGSLTPAEARPRVSTMIQGRTVDPDLTGRENVAFYRDLYPVEFGDWETLAERLELESALDRPVGTYSGGMKQKLELLITLSADADLYVLDEPTSELDLGTQQTVYEALRARRSDGSTVILASHAPLDAEIADRIAMLAEGQVVATGAIDDLRAALPTVVRTDDPTAHTRHLLGGRAFTDGEEIRGFLDPSIDGTEVDGALEADRPTNTDVFNYYSHLASESGE
ncbi:ABC transporter ATP-binding protein [Halovivax gelatinilyticus]|uniref:ABC transporter ATP-binding protein n=1 Tax=Halovivax gelatinilyticus TaxID=2961597 RepID=UPI0020CA9089|nr:ABC transporter ATP-binding protein [Halovivax gelatinilyticus]